MALSFRWNTVNVRHWSQSSQQVTCSSFYEWNWLGHPLTQFRCRQPWGIVYRTVVHQSAQHLHPIAKVSGFSCTLCNSNKVPDSKYVVSDDPLPPGHVTPRMRIANFAYIENCVPSILRSTPAITQATMHLVLWAALDFFRVNYHSLMTLYLYNTQWKAELIHTHRSHQQAGIWGRNQLGVVRQVVSPTLPFPFPSPPLSIPPTFQTNQWEGRSDPVRGKFPGFSTSEKHTDRIRLGKCIYVGLWTYNNCSSRSLHTSGILAI